MAKKKTSTSSNRSRKFSFSLSKQQKILLGSFLFLLGLALFISFVSFLFTWQVDQSEIGILSERKLQTDNWLNKFGANVGHFFVYNGFGIAALFFAFLIMLTGVYYFMGYAKNHLGRFWFWGLLLMIWTSIFLGFFQSTASIFSGTIGFEMNDWLRDYVGFIGTVLILTFVMIVYLVVRLKLTPEMAIDAFKRSKEQITSEMAVDKAIETKPTNLELSEEEIEEEEDSQPIIEEKVIAPSPIERLIIKSEVEGAVAMEVEQAAEEEEVESISNKLVKDFGEFDPKLELSNYKFPPLDLLRDHSAGSGITIDQEELEENKNRIVDTLNNYKIGIANIKAIVGPTVTLYEIVPDAGIRISKIKNLEDDIALSLSALGIRIIAPIPGRGTIGIEVPNKNPRIVSMRSVIASAKFQNAERSEERRV